MKMEDLISGETRKELDEAAETLPSFIKMVDKLMPKNRERELSETEKGNLYAHSKLLAVDAKYAGAHNTFYQFYIAAMFHGENRALAEVMKFMSEKLKEIDPGKYKQVTATMLKYMILDLGGDKMKDILSKIVNKD